MRRTLLLAGLLLVIVLGTVGALVNLRGARAEPLPAPDPSMPILMADGSELPLSEVLDRVARKVTLPEAPAKAPATEPAPSPPAPTFSPPRLAGVAERRELTPEEREALRASWFERRRQRMLDRYGPTFALAYSHENDGLDEQAIALYLSIKEGEPGYAYSRRRVGLHILARNGQPARGLRYVQEALVAEPFNDNSWHDLGRVYAHTLGLPVD